MDSDNIATRTGAEIVVKLITVHIVTTANYAYLSVVQRRQWPGWLGMISVTFFMLAPVVLVVELCTNVLSAIVNFAYDDADDQKTDFGFTFSTALGMHAMFRKRDESPSASSDQTPKQSTPMTKLSCFQCEPEKMKIDYAWMGKVLVCIFTLAQGVGTLINWVQRILFGPQTAGVDDRIGAMGTCTIIISVQVLSLLLHRTHWTMDTPPLGKLVGSTRQSFRSFIHRALITILVQDLTRVAFYQRYPSCPTMPLDFIFKFLKLLWYIKLPFILSGVFLAIFFKVVPSAMLEDTAIGKLFKKYGGDRKLARLTSYAYLGCVILIVFVLVFKIVVDIIETPESDDKYFWRQTQLSETIPVL